MKYRLLSIAILFCFPFSIQAHDTDSITIVQKMTEIEHEISFPYNEALKESIISFSRESLPSTFVSFEELYEAENKTDKIPNEIRYLPMSLSLMKVNYQQGDRCGIWALPSLVAIRYGLTVNAQHDERFSVEASTRAAMRYLSDLYAEFGDWWKCILAYTNSPASVQAAMLRHQDSVMQIWDFAEQEPIQRSEIISDFMACNYVYSTGDRKPKDENEDYVCFAFDQPIALNILSEATGIDPVEIKTQNPIFRSDPIVPKKGYGLLLPREAAKKIEGMQSKLYEETAMLIAEQKRKEAEARALAEAEKREPRYYTVKSGDVLGRIAARNNITISELKEWNHLKSDIIRPGQELIVSKSGGMPKTQASPKAVSNPEEKKSHMVKRGETLSEIAEKYKVTVREIKKWNNLKSDMIREKQRLIIYNKAS
jgi:FOG: LysM repeat